MTRTDKSGRDKAHEKDKESGREKESGRDKESGGGDQTNEIETGENKTKVGQSSNK